MALTSFTSFGHNISVKPVVYSIDNLNLSTKTLLYYNPGGFPSLTTTTIDLSQSSTYVNNLGNTIDNTPITNIRNKTIIFDLFSGGIGNVSMPAIFFGANSTGGGADRPSTAIASMLLYFYDSGTTRNMTLYPAVDWNNWFGLIPWYPNEGTNGTFGFINIPTNNTTVIISINSDGTFKISLQAKNARSFQSNMKYRNFPLYSARLPPSPYIQCTTAVASTNNYFLRLVGSNGGVSYSNICVYDGALL